MINIIKNNCGIINIYETQVMLLNQKFFQKYGFT